LKSNSYNLGNYSQTVVVPWTRSFVAAQIGAAEPGEQEFSVWDCEVV